MNEVNDQDKLENADDGSEEITETKSLKKHRKDTDNPKDKAWFKDLYQFGIDIIIAFVVCIILYQFFVVSGIKEHSMENTLFENDKVILLKKTFLYSDIKRGEVIVFESDLSTDENSNKHKSLIKRVIGIAGDKIEIKNGFVYRNNKKLKETYTKDGITTTVAQPVIVPKGYIYCMGDNRSVSLDSRELGFIPIKRVEGKAIFRIWPLNKIGTI